MDPKAEDYVGMSVYTGMGNNPVMLNDPNGDSPILIGAAVGLLTNGIRNVLNDKNFFDNAIQSTITGAIGGAFSPLGGGSLMEDVIWGAVEGGITGGISSKLNGGKFGDGFKKGALIGGVATFAYNLPQAIQNAVDGYGFGTNMGRWNKLIKESVTVDKAAETWIINKDKILQLVKFTKERYSIAINGFLEGDNSKYIFSTDELLLGEYSLVSGVSMTKNGLIHENYHRIYGPKLEGTDIIRGHGTVGYNDSIREAGKYHINFKATALGKGYKFKSPFQNKAWKAYGAKKWLHLIPRRF